MTDSEIVASAKGIRLNSDEMALAMALARLSHEQWLQRRTEQGFTHGEQRGPNTDPLLVPFDEMKETDRVAEVAAAKGILCLVRSLGYRVIKEKT